MDIQLHYTEAGSGEPLLLLHGNGEDSSYFVHQIAFFSRDYRVIAVDTRGHGQSPRGEAPFTIRQFAQDLLELMDLLKLEKAHILGFSDGGNIALVFALAYPQRVDRLIVNGANLYPRGVRWTVQLPIEIGFRIARRSADKSPEACRHAELLGLMVNDPNLSAEQLSAIRARTLVIAGTRDMIRRSHTELIAGSIPGAKLAFVEGDHFIANRCPEEFNRIVSAFLKEDA